MRCWRNALRRSILLVLGGMLCASGSWAESDCTVWASPMGSPAQSISLGLFRKAARGTSGRPIQIADFWATAKPGDTLCLKDGTYTGARSAIAPPEGLSGLPGAPITVRAENDGGALIDGGLRTGVKGKVPVRLRLNDHFVLEGFDVAYSHSAVISIAGRWTKEGARNGLSHKDWDPIEHVTLRRIVAWDANPHFDDYHECRLDPACSVSRKAGWNANSHVIDVAAARDVLLEDVAAFGTGRKIFQVYLSERVTIRRAWGRWEGNAATATQTFSCAYRSYDSLCENVIGTWSGEQQDPAISIRGQLKSILGMDWFKATDQFQGRDPYDSGLRILGSLAYLPAGVELAPENLVAVGYGKGQVLRDIVAYSGKANSPLHTLALTGCMKRVGCSWERGKTRDEAPLIATRLTSITETGSISIAAEWSGAAGARPVIDRPLLAGQAPNVWSGAGARLCHRYVDGVLTQEPLWPWPMNERIRLATRYARGRATDVDAEVRGLFGPIPAACRVQDEPAPRD